MKRLRLWTAKMSLVFLAATAQAGTMGQEAPMPRDYYIGAFGGGGRLSSTSLVQLGTAFFDPAVLGPLAVNSFGHSNSSSMWIVGGLFGHERLMQPVGNWGLEPAFELEGYYIGSNTLVGEDQSSNTIRLNEHEFLVNYPTTVGVGLVNAVININPSNYPKWRPYVALGLGGAVVSVSGASSFQEAPPEPGVNHYIGDTNGGSDVAFAVQPKVGLRFIFNECLSVFGEYRYLYLSETKFTFGSTVARGHVDTTSWQAKFGSQSYNMGVAGVRVAI